LAEALVKKDTAIRPQFVADEVMKIVSSIQGPIFLTDYEMLFDPRYSIDVIRFFYELSRRAKIVIVSICCRIIKLKGIPIFLIQRAISHTRCVVCPLKLLILEFFYPC
jgi:hypothetical protein